MAKKTFLPTLAYMLGRTCVYITRYRQVIESNLPVGGNILVQNVLDACEALVDAIYHPAGE